MSKQTNDKLVEKIRQLQKAEGSQPCFRTGVLFCKYASTCCWWGVCDHVVVRTFEVHDA